MKWWMLSAFTNTVDVKASKALQKGTSPESAQPWKLECYSR